MKIDLFKTNGSSPLHTENANVPVPEHDDIWTVADAARYLKMSPRQVLELTRRRCKNAANIRYPTSKSTRSVCGSARVMSNSGSKYCPGKRGFNESDTHEQPSA